MRPLLPPTETFSCPECGEESFSYASLCHSCGRQFSERDKSRGTATGPGERHGARNQPRQWEPIIGVGLLLLVIGFALFMWIGGTIQSNAYYAGMAAESRYDWDTAIVHFREAGDHPGAPARLGAATRARDERDRYYKEATQAVAREEWSAALAALDKVREIQPGYCDTDTLFTQAENEVEKAAAAGIIYLVTDGPQPGLYYLDTTGTPVHIPGSDGQSLVRAISAESGMIAYDRPEQGGRVVALTWPAEVSPTGYMTTIPIRASILDPGGTGVFASDGLWWYPPTNQQARPDSERLYFRLYKTDPVWCPTSCGDSILLSDGLTRVAALDPSSSRILLATTSGDSGSPNFHTSLYLAGPWGSNPLLLHEPAGDVDGATFSPDGRWLLYITEQNNEANSRRLWVSRVPDSAGRGSFGTPRQIGFLQNYGDESAILIGRFLYSHNGETLMAITRRTGFSERLSVYTLSDSDSINLDGFGWPTGAFRTFASQIDLVEPENPYGHHTSAFAHKGLMLANHWQQGLRSQLSLYSRQGERTMRYTFPFPLSGSRPARLYFSPNDDYLVAALSGRPGTGGDSIENVYVTRVNRDQPPGSPQLLTSIRLPQSPNQPTLALPASGTHFVYVNDAQALRAARYTGEKDILLAENVSGVWDLHTGPEGTWQR